MARPLRFRHSPESWSADRVERTLYQPLDGNLGAESMTPHYKPPGGWTGRRFEMDNGDFALFVYHDEDGAYWIGNTETPSTLWQTDKYGWEEIPYPVARWAQRELLADLVAEEPWLDEHDHLAWFFLPVFMSKDGSETSRAFFRKHAAGFPDTDPEDAIAYYEDFLSTGVLDDHRDEMSGKLGTSETMDLVRMAAAMSEFTVAKLLTDAGYEVEPEIEVTTGHSIDFRAVDPDTGEGTLVEVTRPRPPARRVANTPVAAVRDTAETKTDGQLSEHGGGVVLFVDCSSFADDQWFQVRGERPDVRHRPAVVYWTRPGQKAQGYRKGSVPLDLDDAIDFYD